VPHVLPISVFLILSPEWYLLAFLKKVGKIEWIVRLEWPAHWWEVAAGMNDRGTRYEGLQTRGDLYIYYQFMKKGPPWK
jgi:hypothetical protein